jgi:hypothetical protein
MKNNRRKAWKCGGFFVSLRDGGREWRTPLKKDLYIWKGFRIFVL